MLFEAVESKRQKTLPKRERLYRSWRMRCELRMNVSLGMSMTGILPERLLKMLEVWERPWRSGEMKSWRFCRIHYIFISLYSTIWMYDEDLYLFDGSQSLKRQSIPTPLTPSLSCITLWSTRKTSESSQCFLYTQRQQAFFSSEYLRLLKIAYLEELGRAYIHAFLIEDLSLPLALSLGIQVATTNGNRDETAKFPFRKCH